MDPTEQPTLIDQAAAWLAALDSGTADPQAFAAWRDADPRHAVAFAQVAATWESLGNARAIAPVGVDIAPPRPAPAVSRRHLLQAAASVAVVAGIGGVGSRVWARSSAETAVGERRTILCEDGTRLDLNTDSAVAWRIRGTRQLWLERGEIALDVASAPGALTVHVGDTALALAPGRYNLRARDEAVDVLVLGAGRAVAAAGISASMGQRLAVVRGAATALSASEAERDRAAGWRRGEVVFAGEPLGIAIGDYNRYLTRKLVVGDPRLASIRLGGRFTSNDPGDFLRALRASFDIEAIPRGDVTMLIPARAQK
jgi:transmembrane sensor